MIAAAFISHYDCSRHDTGWNHPDHQGRLPGLMRAVHADMLTLFDRLLEVEGRHATLEELRLVHSESYLTQVESWVEEAARIGNVIEPATGIRVSGASMDAARAAVGCTLTAVDRILDGEVSRAFCAVRPPGRYVTGTEPAVFGLLNTVTTCVRYFANRIAEREMGGKAGGRPFVLELGGPAGSPTGRLAEGDAAAVVGVYQASADRPAENERYLEAGAGASAFMDALEQVLEIGSGDYPALVLSLGFDGLSGDPLGDLGLASADYHAATLRIRRFADERCEGRIVSILEGGYEARGLGAATVQHLRALVGFDPIG